MNDELARKAAGAPAVADTEDESDWGAADSDDADDLWDDDSPIRPDIVLIEALSGRDDELSDFMEMYMFSCLGEIDNRTV